MEETNATETETIASPEGQTPTLTQEEDLEARFKQLEEEKDNYKKAYLKEAEKNKASKEDRTLTDDEKFREIAREELANSRVVDIAKEQQTIIERALKENKELKLALGNKQSGPAAALGSHSEAQAVRDNSLSPEQEKYFRETLKWSDKDIEKYKKLSSGRR